MLALALMTAACGSSDKDYDASGVFEATEVIVSAKAQGEIMSLAADEGGIVKRGDLLGRIDATQLNLQKEQLEQTRLSTDSRKVDVHRQIASLQQQADNLRREKARFEDLLKAGAASQKQVDDIVYQISVTEKQIVALRDQFDSSNEAYSGQSRSVEAQISQISEKINDATIVSPIDGTILQRYCEAGEYAMPGTPLFKIADMNDMTLRAYITAGQYETLKVGQKVGISIDGREKPYEGTVTWIATRAEFTPKTIKTKDERANLVYAVKIKVANDGMIKIGMYGDVKL
ncbi:MAG: HlyD family secretion protein [Prevotella sp.]